jgi:hypothetical protein
MTRALSFCSESWPLVVYATGTLCIVTPDSRVKEGRMAKDCSATSCENGFSGCDVIVSTGFSSCSYLGVIVEIAVEACSRHRVERVGGDWGKMCARV